MSYQEYLDLFFETQKKECPYRAFSFDIKNCRTLEEYQNNFMDYHNAMEYLHSLIEQEEIITNHQILLRDENNMNYYSSKNIRNGNTTNPMICGDQTSFFVYNGLISTQRILELFRMALKKYNITYSFHFETGVYQTNDYGQGSTKMYKGYMPHILEHISKKNNKLISQSINTCEKEM